MFPKKVGQSVIIALSVVAFNIGEMYGPLGHYHRFSLYFLLPYLGTTLPLLYHNWYPSSVFAGKNCADEFTSHFTIETKTLQETRSATSAG